MAVLSHSDVIRDGDNFVETNSFLDNNNNNNNENNNNNNEDIVDNDDELVSML